MRPTLASSTALALLLLLSNAAIGVAQPPAQGTSPGQPSSGQAAQAMQGVLLPMLPNQPGAASLEKGSNDLLYYGDPSAGGFNQWYFSAPNRSVNFAWIDDASRNSGMTLAPADPALRAHLGLAKGQGLIVTAVEAGSPADLAGIQPNDVLLRLGQDGGKPASLARPEDLEKGLKAIGERPASLVLLRAAKEMTLKVQPRLKAHLGPVPAQAQADLGYWIGIQATTVEPALRAQLQLPQDQGLIINEVVKDTPAARAGIQVHDILLKIDDAAVADTEALAKHVQERADRPVKIELVRGGRKRDVQVTPERRKISSFVVDFMPKSTQFEVFLPGAVLPKQEVRDDAFPIELRRYLDELYQSKNDALRSAALVVGHTLPSGVQGTAKGGKSTDQRLDELSSQMQELRRAIEGLAKAQGNK